MLLKRSVAEDDVTASSNFSGVQSGTPGLTMSTTHSASSRTQLGKRGDLCVTHTLIGAARCFQSAGLPLNCWEDFNEIKGERLTRGQERSPICSFKNLHFSPRSSQVLHMEGKKMFPPVLTCKKEPNSGGNHQCNQLWNRCRHLRRVDLSLSNKIKGEIMSNISDSLRRSEKTSLC